jgi:hypothetical protein
MIHSKVLKWAIWFGVASALFFGGLALRMRTLGIGGYTRPVAGLFMFLGVIIFGTLLVYFLIKNLTL